MSMLKYFTNRVRTICNICNFVARDNDDIEKMSTEGCCTECYNNFRFIYGKSWDSGKRPTVDEARSKMLIFIQHNLTYEFI